MAGGGEFLCEHGLILRDCPKCWGRQVVSFPNPFKWIKKVIKKIKGGKGDINKKAVKQN